MKVNKKKTYTIGIENKLPNGSYTVPSIKEIPEKYWGLVTMNKDIMWEENDN